MGNSTIKRQVLTAAVTLTLFTLGSVGVATAGLVFDNIVTKLEGKAKGGKECGENPGIKRVLTPTLLTVAKFGQYLYQQPER